MRAPAVLLATAALLAPLPAFAQGTNIDTAGIVKLACASGDPTTERELPLSSLAEAILVQSGYPVSDLIALGRRTSGDAYRDALLNLVVANPGMNAEVARRVRANTLALSQALRPNSSVTEKDLKLRMMSGPTPTEVPYDRYWFLRDPAAIRLQCLAGKAPQPVVQIVNAPLTVPTIGIVKAVEDLAKAEKREAVDSAVLGIKVAKTRQEDGTSKRATTLTFDGTIGARLTPATVQLPAFLYANYTLSRARERPAVPLAPGVRRDEDDTNGLALGLLVADVALPLHFSLQGSASYVADFVKDSRRGVGTLQITPGFNATDAGLCGLGYLKPVELFGRRLRSRCIIAAEVSYSHVFDAGRADFSDRGDFVAAGPIIGLDLVAPLNESTGIVGNARYRYLPTISGRAPTVSRLDLSLKYRWWVGGGVGIDLGGTYKRGEELKTYTNEDEFLISFGVVH